ncbi:hypothetical protein A2U01_0057819, partial [Trifolium medium]|nr:hypothetical protein [Trifolium medium]
RPIPTVDTLPDSVICHILSFLPTKQSAATKYPLQEMELTVALRAHSRL